MSETTPISEAERAAWEGDGFLVVRGLFDAAAMAQIAEWARALETWPEIPGSWMKYYEDSLTSPGLRVLSRIENFVPCHAGLAAVVGGEALAGRVAALFGEPVVLFKEKVNFKLPGGGGFAAHQDIQAGWDAYAENFITALLSIDPATEANGCLEMAASHHRRGSLGEPWRPLDDDDLEGVTFTALPTAPSDAVFFDAFAPHRSAANTTAEARRVLYVTYNRTAEGDHRLRYYADKRASYPPDCEREPGKAYVFRV